MSVIIAVLILIIIIIIIIIINIIAIAIANAIVIVCTVFFGEFVLNVLDVHQRKWVVVGVVDDDQTPVLESY